MKKRLLAMMTVLMVCCTAGCGADKNVDEPEAKTQKEATEGSFSVVVNPDTGYTYTVYGRLHDYERLTGSDCGVVAIQPLTEGGESYEGYPWMTCYVPSGVMDKLEALDYSPMDETVAFAATIQNDTDGGGFIDLPEIMVDFEQITVGDIPVWGGQ